MSKDRNKQPFQRGDWVKVADDLGPSMSHFTDGVEAIVIGSYDDKYGCDNYDSYTLHLKGYGECSWYNGYQLTMLGTKRYDLLDEWEEKEEREKQEKSNLDWIFTHGKEVLAEGYGASVQTLADCFGLKNLWGNRGEGVTYYSNTIATLQIARPFLETGNKDGYLAHCATIKLV